MRTYLIEVSREPLIEDEEVIKGYALDADAFDHAPHFKRRLAEEIGYVLSSPGAIFGGLQRENYHDDAFCYSAAPGGWTQTSHVLLAFATIDGETDEMVVFDWELLFADRVYPNRPNGWPNDFGDPLWSLSSEKR